MFYIAILKNIWLHEWGNSNQNFTEITLSHNNLDIVTSNINNKSVLMEQYISLCFLDSPMEATTEEDSDGKLFIN